jgi:hypothetical protein
MCFVFKFYSASSAYLLKSLGKAAFTTIVFLLSSRRVSAFTANALHVGYLWGLSLFVVLSLLDEKVRRISRGLAAEFAYLAIVGTSILPPRSLLRCRLARVITPDVVSYLAIRTGGDDPDIFTNSMLGIRLGGIPKCDLLLEVLPELYELCLVLKSKGREPLYKVLPDVVVPLAISVSAAGFEEGDMLLSSYRAAATGNDKDVATAMRYFRKWYIAVRF